MEVFQFNGAPSSFLLEHHHPLAIKDCAPVEGFVRPTTGQYFEKNRRKLPPCRRRDAKRE